MPHLESNPSIKQIDFTRDDFDIDSIMNNKDFQTLIRQATS